jgi:hypothetical protein
VRATGPQTPKHLQHVLEADSLRSLRSCEPGRARGPQTPKHLQHVLEADSLRSLRSCEPGASNTQTPTTRSRSGLASLASLVRARASQGPQTPKHLQHVLEADSLRSPDQHLTNWREAVGQARPRQRTPKGESDKTSESNKSERSVNYYTTLIDSTPAWYYPNADPMHGTIPMPRKHPPTPRQISQRAPRLPHDYPTR